jgi:hypothetical protein
MAGKHAAGVAEKRFCDETFAASGLERFSLCLASLAVCGWAGLSPEEVAICGRHKAVPT